MSSEPGPDVTTESATDPYRPPEAEPVTVETADSSTLLEGVVTGIGIVVAHGLFMMSELWVLAAFFVGVTQWLLVVPLAVYWHRRGRRAATRGLLIVAGVVFLLNATCMGFFFATVDWR